MATANTKKNVRESRPAVKTLEGGILDPVLFGEIPLKTRTFGTPYTDGGTGFNLTLNRLPPGMDIENQDTAEHVKKIMAEQPMGPIFQHNPKK